MSKLLVVAIVIVVVLVVIYLTVGGCGSASQIKAQAASDKAEAAVSVAQAHADVGDHVKAYTSFTDAALRHSKAAKVQLATAEVMMCKYLKRSKQLRNMKDLPADLKSQQYVIDTATKVSEAAGLYDLKELHTAYTNLFALISDYILVKAPMNEAGSPQDVKLLLDINDAFAAVDATQAKLTDLPAELSLKGSAVFLYLTYYVTLWQFSKDPSSPVSEFTKNRILKSHNTVTQLGSGSPDVCRLIDNMLATAANNLNGPASATFTDDELQKLLDGIIKQSKIDAAELDSVSDITSLVKNASDNANAASYHSAMESDSKVKASVAQNNVVVEAHQDAVAEPDPKKQAEKHKQVQKEVKKHNKAHANLKHHEKAALAHHLHKHRHPATKPAVTPSPLVPKPSDSLVAPVSTNISVPTAPVVPISHPSHPAHKHHHQNHIKPTFEPKPVAASPLLPAPVKHILPGVPTPVKPDNHPVVTPIPPAPTIPISHPSHPAHTHHYAHHKHPSNPVLTHPKDKVPISQPHHSWTPSKKFPMPIFMKPNGIPK